MMCRHKLDSEDWNQHNARRRGIIAAALDRAKTMPLSLQACHLYFGWAGHLVRLPATRPVRRVVGWRDLWWFRSRSDGPEGLVRPRLAKCGMPSRWEDTLEKHIGIGWSTYGVDRKGWCIKKWTVATNCWVKLLNKKAIGQAWHDPVAHISPRLESSVPKLAGHLKKISWTLVADNMQIVQQTSGVWAPKNNGGTEGRYSDIIKQCRWLEHALAMRTGLVFAPGKDSFLMHRHREYNSYSDGLANYCLDMHDVQFHVAHTLKDGDALMTCVDGASRGNPGPSGIGASLWVFSANQAPTLLAHCGIRVADTTNVDAEFQSMLMGFHLAIDWISLYSSCTGPCDMKQLRVLTVS